MSTEQFKEATPLMKQYFEIKEHYPNTLLFFQVGDFYELFFEDAKTAAHFLGITLTARGTNKGEPIPLCGVPVHTKDHYIKKLVLGGFFVALCEQLEPARPGIVVARGVTQVFTPGTLTDSQMLDEKTATYLCALVPGKEHWGIVFGELLTAQLYATVLPASDQRLCEAELSRFFPAEIIVPDTPQGKLAASFCKKSGYCVTPIAEHVDAHADMVDMHSWIANYADQSSHEFLQCTEPIQAALHYFYAYVRRNQRFAIDQKHTLHLYHADEFLQLDAMTQRNIELVQEVGGGKTHTLLSVIDRAATPMGSRLLKKWVVRPLMSHEAIAQRQNVIDYFMRAPGYAQNCYTLLKKIGDLERSVGRIGIGKAPINDYLFVLQALDTVPQLHRTLPTQQIPILLQTIAGHIVPMVELHTLLHSALNTDTVVPHVIRTGYDQKLDAMRTVSSTAHEQIAALESQQQQETGIASLKIRYNQVQGYYVEITNTHKHLIPDHYVRQQTLVGKERFTFPALQQLAYQVLTAQNEITAYEEALFVEVKKYVVSHVIALRKLCYALANMDALLSLALVAAEYRYVRPTFNDTRSLYIESGRHPVVERAHTVPFIPNNTRLDDDQSVWIITGPNMGGKSTYLRQNALIVILAQMGSFVPAAKASLFIVDRIFTRIGAGDNVSQGKSTFLVEMEETALICTQATHKSLVILDEVGRGTSTFDGLAIAQAVVEHIYTTIGARALFATHYHELTDLAHQHTGIANYYAVSAKQGQIIVFLYTIAPGVAPGSFGIEIARMAALPLPIIQRAQTLLAGLAEQPTRQISTPEPMPLIAMPIVADTSGDDTETRHARKLKKLIDAIDMDNLTPKKAFDMLWQMKDIDSFDQQA